MNTTYNNKRRGFVETLFENVYIGRVKIVTSATTAIVAIIAAVLLGRG